MLRFTSCGQSTTSDNVIKYRQGVKENRSLLFPGVSQGRAIETPHPGHTILDEIPIPEPDIVDMPYLRNDAFFALSILRKRSPPLRPSERRQCFSVNNSI